METKTKKFIQLNRELLTIDSSLSGKLEKSITPEILRMQEELRAVTSQVKNFLK